MLSDARAHRSPGNAGEGVPRCWLGRRDVHARAVQHRSWREWLGYRERLAEGTTCSLGCRDCYIVGAVHSAACYSALTACCQLQHSYIQCIAVRVSSLLVAECRCWCLWQSYRNAAVYGGHPAFRCGE